MTETERLARVIEPMCAAFGKGEMPFKVAQEFVRAILTAMREPSEAMLTAADEAASDASWWAHPKEAWQSMIDAILNENAETVTVWGDGVHDDTEALQAFLDGRIVCRSDGKPFRSMTEPGVYLIARPLNPPQPPQRNTV